MQAAHVTTVYVGGTYIPCQHTWLLWCPEDKSHDA